MKSFHMYTKAATGGRFRPTPITVLLERGERASFESFTHFVKQQIKRIKTGANNIKADADRCKQTQTVSLVDVTQSLDNNISPPKLIWSAQPRCWPRPIIQRAPHSPDLLTAIDIGQLKLNNG